MFYLDTNTCIFFLNGKSENIKKKILSIPPSEICIPSIVKAELIFGALKSMYKEKTLEKLENFLEPFEIIPFQDQMTYHYAEIRNEVESKGTVIGPNDILIASITRFHEATLVTNNVKEFSRVSNLLIEDWK